MRCALHCSVVRTLRRCRLGRLHGQVERHHAGRGREQQRVTGIHQRQRGNGGGGHRNASGAFVQRPLEPLIRDVMDAAPRYLDLDTPESAALDDADADYLALLRGKFHAS